MKKSAPSGTIIFCNPMQLRPHPHKIRQRYPADQVREMADSILARGGVDHALLVVAAPEKGTYYIEDGDLRFKAALLLGDRCPRLKCEVTTHDHAEQMAVMHADKVRFDPDPISEAEHFHMLRYKDGLTLEAIVARTGRNATHITNRLKLMDLDPEVRELVAEGRFPRDQRIVEPLMSIPDKPARVKLAKRLAEANASFKTIVASCAALKKQLAETSERSRGIPALDLARKRTKNAAPAERERISMPAIREAAKTACATCDIHESMLQDVPEPAWILITHATDKVCGRCPVRQVRGACESCPAVELLQRIIVDAKGKLDAHRS